MVKRNWFDKTPQYEQLRDQYLLTFNRKNLYLRRLRNFEGVKTNKYVVGTHYLDHAGATLYSEKQLRNIFTELSQNIFANPHAGNLAGKLSEDIVDQVRYE